MSDAAMEPLMITDPAGLAEIEDEWRELAERRSNIFVTPEWVRAWWDQQGSRTSELRIVSLRRGGELLGVMPLAFQASGRPRLIRFAGAGLGDRFHPAALPEDEPAVAEAAMTALERHGLTRHMLLLEHVEPGRPWLGALRACSPRRLSETERSRTELPYIPLEGLDWEQFVSERSKNFRSEIRRRERVMRRDHGMVDRLATETTLESDLAHLFRLHAMRWQGRDDSTLMLPEAQATLGSLAAAALGRGWLRLHVIEAEGAVVAAMLAWRVGDSYAYYNSGFDPGWANKSIGTVLMAVAIRSAIEEGAREFDLLLGTEAYKRRFTSSARPGTTLVLTPAMRPLSLIVAGEARARGIGRRLAGVPGLRRLTHRLNRNLPTSRL